MKHSRPPQKELLRTPEQKRRYQLLVAYIHSRAFTDSLYRNLEGMKILARPGVTFTAEQKAQVEKMVAAGREDEAQRAILNQLKEEFGD